MPEAAATVVRSCQLVPFDAVELSDPLCPRGNLMKAKALEYAFSSLGRAVILLVECVMFCKSSGRKSSAALIGDLSRII